MKASYGEFLMWRYDMSMWAKTMGTHIELLAPAQLMGLSRIFLEMPMVLALSAVR